MSKSRFLKRLSAFILSVLILFGSFPLSTLGVFDFDGLFSVKAKAANITSYKTGDIIEFGWYPQSEVTDSSLISALNDLGGEWKSYGYYSGTGSYSDGNMTAGDYMRYKDVIYNSKKYRAVTFDSYRPYWTGGTSSSGNSYQYDNGYYTGNVYWFKYEPVKWRVLAPDTGLLLSETILDSQAYNNYILYSGTDEYGYSAYYGDEEKTYYSNNYEKSSIREWLNRDFYCTAFSAAQQNIIQYTTLNNKAYSNSYSAYDSADTSDKIYLLSYADALNSNYFSGNSARKAQGSDYAKCQGLWVKTNTSSSYYGNARWRLRSAGSDSGSACTVSITGDVYYYYSSHNTSSGVRPALNLNPKSSIFQSDVKDAGTDFEGENDKSIAIFTTERSLCVNTGESMWLAFGLIDESTGLAEENWRKMAVAVSDNTVVSLSDYKETEYGYSLEVKGEKEGATNITVTDTELGVSTVITVTVFDKYSKTYSYDINKLPSFYPNNKWEQKLSTNIYNLSGLYVNNYSCSKASGDNNYYISFDVYNTRYYNGAVDIYDADGVWTGSEYIDKYSDITSIKETVSQTYYMIKNLVDGEILSYQSASSSKKTEIRNLKIPEGGYFVISNNFAESPGTFFANSFEILYDTTSDLLDFATSKDIDGTSFDNFYKTATKSFAQNVIDARNEGLPGAAKKKLMEVALGTMTSEIKKITKKFVKANVTDYITVGTEMYSEIASLAENLLSSYNISWKHLYQLATGVAESAFIKFSGPAGVALKACFSITKGTNKLLMATQMAYSTNNTYANVYSKIDEGYINPYGVIVNTNGNTDAEAVLQVFRVSNSDSIDVLLNSDNPLENHELYNICFVKDDKLVQPNGKVKVHIPVPEGMNGNTCKVYRQESDGTWTILDAHIEGNYLVFETDHFSLYSIIGDMYGLSVYSSPDKTVYAKDDVLNTDGLILEMNGELISEGYICEPTVLSKVGKTKITVHYGAITTEFYVTVGDSSVLYGDVNGDGQLTPSDVVLLRRYFANYDSDTETSTIEVTAGADVNGDGSLTPSDVVLLRRYFANYNSETETSTIVLGK